MAEPTLRRLLLFDRVLSGAIGDGEVTVGDLSSVGIEIPAFAGMTWGRTGVVPICEIPAFAGMTVVPAGSSRAR